MECAGASPLFRTPPAAGAARGHAPGWLCHLDAASAPPPARSGDLAMKAQGHCWFGCTSSDPHPTVGFPDVTPRRDRRTAKQPPLAWSCQCLPAPAVKAGALPKKTPMQTPAGNPQSPFPLFGPGLQVGGNPVSYFGRKQGIPPFPIRPETGSRGRWAGDFSLRVRESARRSALRSIMMMARRRRVPRRPATRTRRVTGRWPWKCPDRLVAACRVPRRQVSSIGHPNSQTTSRRTKHTSVQTLARTTWYKVGIY